MGHLASLHQKALKMVNASLSHGKPNTQCTQEMTTKGVSVVRGEMAKLIVHKREKTMIQTVQMKIMTRIMTMETTMVGTTMVGTTMVGTMIATKVKMSKMKVVIM